MRQKKVNGARDCISILELVCICSRPILNLPTQQISVELVLAQKVNVSGKYFLLLPVDSPP